MTTDITTLAFALVDLGELALQFGMVDRITHHPDGITPESDTDHTVMLGWLACALAAKCYPTQLDVGLVAQYALVHDAPEVFAGDTPTLRITDDERAAKKEREEAALTRLVKTFTADRGGIPWFPMTLMSYEIQRAPEARFVRALDKVLPQITDALNGASMMDEHGVDAAELRATLDKQREDIRAYAGEFPIVLELHALMTDRVCALMEKEEASA